MADAAHVDVPIIDWRPLWNLYSVNYDQLLEQMVPAGEEDVHRELLFCLLGGHAVSYELARSATEVCDRLDVFASGWAPDELEARLSSELSAAQFLPLKRDGTPRRYRYPRRKAHLVVRARSWLLERPALTRDLPLLDDERDRRAYVCGCPGIGPKTASWLLRNLGYAHKLAVLDVHVLRAMVTAGVLPSTRLPQDYEQIEASYLAWCEEIEASPAAFDLFLWEFQRGRMSVAA
jgi:N-glycosylase/DNA lyase